ncbi:MAG: primosomal protein N' [Bacteroidetes bacterium]|nr:primosomal protein N' [Bacteroidota bacterium]
MRKTLFVNVLLPLPVAGLFTYRVPFDLNESVETGKRVVVQFGQKKVYTGLIHSITEKPPPVQAKYILSVLDLKPIVNDIQFRFWEWMADYYCCYQGEVMNAALPSAFKLASESKVLLNPDAVIDPENLNEKEYTLLIALQENGKLSLSEVSRTLELVKVIPIIHTLIEKGYILTEEELGEKFKPRMEVYIKLAPEYEDEKELQALYGQLEKKAPKRLEILIEYVQQSHCLTEHMLEVTRTALLHRTSDGTSRLSAMLKKGIFEQYEKEVSRLKAGTATDEVSSIELTSFQSKAYSEIQHQFKSKNVVLLHGVTSSGKTEMYIKLIRETLDAGKQVLYLLPEIALTTQIINRLTKYFGSEAGIYHSRYDENERVEIWQKVANSMFFTPKTVIESGMDGTSLQGSYQVILGARSALFLPYCNLGLIIVDEEHDSSFKQYDPAPRYNARDAAIFLASLHQCRVLLGTATPSIESYFNAQAGKYGLVNVSERFGGMQMPAIEVVDLREEHKKKRMKSIFSLPLLENIDKTLAQGEQVILFQNRRGFSLHIDCDNCNWVPQCIQCDVSLVYHKKDNLLRCHYCGYSTRIPDKCPDCGYTGLMMKGFGTEKIEEELSIFFPNARIARMDLDSTRTRNAMHRIISDFEEQRIDILAGTQMVTKGLDFDHVSLVGILNADSLLSYPDFRAYERSYQLMAQVAGRSGRKNKQGKVMIQAFNPKHEIIKFVIHNDYQGMYNQQLSEREKFKYPPYYRLIQLTLKNVHQEELNKASAELAKTLRNAFGKRVLGPEFPQVSRIRNLYLKNILIKLEKGVNLLKTKELILSAISKMNSQPDFRQVRVIIDVDPL